MGVALWATRHKVFDVIYKLFWLNIQFGKRLDKGIKPQVGLYTFIIDQTSFLGCPF